MRALLAGALAATLLAGAAHGTTRIPYNERVRRSVEQAFLRDGRPSELKIAAYREMIEDKIDFIEEHVYDYRRELEGEKKKKARKKAAKTDSITALGYVLEALVRLEAAQDEAEAYRWGARALTVDFATRSYHYPLGSIQMPIYIGNMLVDWSAEGHTPRGGGAREAANLVDATTGEFYAADELDAQIAAGADLSLLQPPGDGVLWAPTDIPNLDVLAQYFGGGDPQHESVPTRFPPYDGAVVTLKKLRLTQTKPKMDVYWYDAACMARREAEREDCGKKYKLKFGAESHSDPVVNILMSAVGYNTDVSSHVKNVKVYLGETTYGELARDWANYFDVQDLWTRLELDKALLPGEAGHGRDAGGEYLVFRAAGIEAKPEELERIGPYSNGLIQKGAVATSMREARGLFLFNVWVANTDLKDAENYKLIIRRDLGDEWRWFLSQQDTGNALGLILAEKVDAFPWEAVETSWWSRAFGAVRGRIELNYFALQQTGLYDTATYADHRWMARLIARLSREQIETAVAEGHWPGGIGPLFVEKLVNRRNTLVRYFGLSDEFQPLPVDRKLTTTDGTVVKGKVVTSRFPEETPVDFGNHWASLAKPVGPALWRQARRMVAIALSSVDSIGADVELEGGVELFPELLIHLERDVVPNPSPKGQLDQYIVADTFNIGFRLGVGKVAQGRATIERTYRLAYTAPSDWEARLYGNQALNWFLPLNARRGKLPERYVLLRDTAYGPGLAVRSPDPVEVTAGADLAIDLLWSRRLTIDHSPEKGSVVWLEKGQALEGEGRVWVKFWVLRYTFWKAVLEAGRRHGDLYVLRGEEAGSDEAVEAAVAEALKSRYAKTRELGADAQRKTKVTFTSLWRQTNLIFVKWQNRDRREWVEVAQPDGSPIGHQFQVSRQKNFRWSVFDNGESFTAFVQGFRDPDFAEPEKRGGEQPVIVLSFLIDDKNTHSDELKSYYDFIESLGGGKEYLADPFVATDWEQTGTDQGRWGRVLTEAQLTLGGGALDALAELDADAFWSGLSDALGLSHAELRERRRRFASADAKERIRARLALPFELRRAVYAGEGMLRALRAARREEDPEDRLAELTRALYRAVHLHRGVYSPHVLGTALKTIHFKQHVKQEDASVRSRISTAVEDENKLPERKDFVGRYGKRHVGEIVDVIGDPFDAVELYYMLDWARGEPKVEFIAPEALR